MKEPPRHEEHVQVAIAMGSEITFEENATNMPPHISIVTTMYRSRPFLERFLAECLQALAELECTEFEIVLVNDGSPDDSLDYALERRKDIPQLVVVDLSRNFGHHQAIHTGLSVSKGRLVFLIDCDLEVSPRVLAAFYECMKAEPCDVVYGFQEMRKGAVVERLGGAIFYKLFNLMSDFPIPENSLTEKLMTRRYVQGLLELGDRNLFLAGMMHWAGFKQIGLAVPKNQREGASTYTLLRRIGLMVNAITSFSSKPLVWLFHFGVSITSVSFLYGVFLVVRKLVYQDQVGLGFTTIVAMIVLSLGVITMCLGVVGIYLAKIYDQVRGRPIVLIRDIYR